MFFNPEIFGRNTTLPVPVAKKIVLQLKNFYRYPKEYETALRVLELRFGFPDKQNRIFNPKTRAGAAAMLRVSPETLQRIEKKLILRLKTLLELELDY